MSKTAQCRSIPHCGDVKVRMRLLHLILNMNSDLGKYGDRLVIQFDNDDCEMFYGHLSDLRQLMNKFLDEAYDLHADAWGP